MKTASNRRPGSDWTRRDFLRTASVGGAAAIASLAARPSTGDWTVPPGFGRARSCLMIFLAGGPSHIDTFDPKPDAPAEVRGEFNPIATRVPGLYFSEHLPRLAARADRFTVVRSMTHGDATHAGAVYRSLTGRPCPHDEGRPGPLSRQDDPHVGSIAASGEASAAGRFVTIPGLLGAPGPAWAGQHAGALGADHDPRVVRDSRPVSPRIVERYGRGRFGRSVLLGLRLVEAGARFVQVNWAGAVDSGWDTHADGFAALKDALLPAADRALSALLDDLAGDGRLDETLVVVLGEFGRSPRVTAGGGRGHWPAAYSALLAGARIAGGRALGATDRTGASPVDRPVDPGSLAASILLALGVRPTDPGPGPVPDLWS